MYEFTLIDIVRLLIHSCHDLLKLGAGRFLYALLNLC